MAVAPQKFSFGKMQNDLSAARAEADKLRKDLQETRREFQAVADDYNGRINMLERRLLALVGETPPPAPANMDDGSQAPLWQWLKTVLKASNEPLPAKEISQLVREAGYVTTSSPTGFVDVVQTCLNTQTKHFRRVKGRLKRPVRWECIEEESSV